MLLPVGPPPHIAPYRPVNLLYGVIDARACIAHREYPSARTYATPRFFLLHFFPRPPVCRFSPTSCSPFYHLYLDVLRVRPAVLWPAVLSRFRGDAPRYCRHSICPARSALYVRTVPYRNLSCMHGHRTTTLLPLDDCWPKPLINWTPIMMSSGAVLLVANIT